MKTGGITLIKEAATLKDFATERARALEAWAAHVVQGEAAANVVKLERQS